MRWPSIKAKKLVSFKTGKIDSNAAEHEGKYPFFTCANQTYRINSYAFDTECVLLAGNNAAGVFPLKYYNGKFNAYQRTYVIEPLNRKELNTRYLYDAFKLFLESFKQTSTGVTTKFLTMGILSNLWISLPPLPIQRKIAAVLSSYDDLIENNNRRIAILEKMAEELYREWFVRLRFPGHEKVKIVKGVPEGWDVKKIGDVITFIGGGTPSKENSKYWNEGNVNWFTPSDLTSKNSIFSFDSSLKCNFEGIKNSSTRLFPEYSVMMTSRATIGVVSINTTQACTNQGFITCIPNERLPLYYLFNWLKSSRQHFLNLSSGATFSELTKSTFKKISILCPEKRVLDYYMKISTTLYTQIESKLKQVEILKVTRDRLLSRLMSGKIDVENLDIQFPKSMQEENTDE